MQSLTISSNHHYLMHADGTPFFYLGDTAWELFHRLTREEADLYLRNRAEKGFTVIQAVILAEFSGLTVPNPYGDLPLEDCDPTRPVEAYFRHVDAVVARAAELGLTMGLLPTWGDKVPEKVWGEGPEVFTPENAYVFGTYLGQRYADAPVIWILGGDRGADTPFKLDVWRAMARGLRDGDGGRHLIGYHPWGEHSSSEYVHEEAWLDLNMIQSGHGKALMASYDMISADYQRRPTKPVLDAEPCYEDHPIAFQHDGSQGWFDEHHVRQRMYWSLLGGGCGVTYGCHDIWQFWTPERTPVTAARTDWHTALDLPAASQMKHLRALYESRPFPLLAPDTAIIADGQREGMEHVQAARATDGSFAFVYIPAGTALTVHLDALAGATVCASWFDPRTGAWQAIGEMPATAQTFTPPTSGWGQDWVLVVDAVA